MRHPLSGNGEGTPDFILNLEGGGGRFGGGNNEGARVVNITSAEFLATSNYNVNGNGAGRADMIIAADAQATLPALIEEVKKAHHRRPPPPVRGARKETCGSQPGNAETGHDDCPLWLEFQPGQSGPDRSGDVGAGQRR